MSIDDWTIYDLQFIERLTIGRFTIYNLLRD